MISYGLRALILSHTHKQICRCSFCSNKEQKNVMKESLLERVYLEHRYLVDYQSLTLASLQWSADEGNR